MGFRPLHDWVLIKRSESEEKTHGGIIIPDTAKTKPIEGVVVSAGPGRYRQEKGKKEKKFIPTVLKPGQHVMFVDYMAKDVRLNGEEITLIREEDILGTIEDSVDLSAKKHAHETAIKRDRQHIAQTSSKKAATDNKAKEKNPRDMKKETAAGTAPQRRPKKNKTGSTKESRQKVAKKAAAKKTKEATVTKKTATKKSVARKAVSKKSVPKKMTAQKAAPLKKTAAKKNVLKKTAKKTKR